MLVLGRKGSAIASTFLGALTWPSLFQFCIIRHSCASQQTKILCDTGNRIAYVVMDTRITDTCIIDIEVDKEVLVNFAWVTRPERLKGVKDEGRQTSIILL